MLDRSWWRGSLLLALVGTILFSLTTWAHRASPKQTIPTLWPMVLILLWISLASTLIGYALKCGARFSEAAKQICGDCDLLISRDWKACSLISRRIVLVGVPFVFLGFFAAILAPVEIHWRLVRAFLVCSCFYYASFGLWGSYAVSRSVELLAREASRTGKLDAFHPDHLAGLGFAKS